MIDIKEAISVSSPKITKSNEFDKFVQKFAPSFVNATFHRQVANSE